MTITFTESKDWPPDFLSQLLIFQEIEDRLNSLRLKSKSVQITSKREPTKEEWESAYLEQTTQQPPIPIGTRLIWTNPFREVARAFTVLNDEELGFSSSGEPHEYLSSDRHRGHLRLLGKSYHDRDEYYNAGDLKIGIQNVYNSQWGEYTLTGEKNLQLIGNWKNWINRGLLGCYIIFSMEVSGAFTLSIQGGEPGTTSHFRQEPQAVSTWVNSVYVTFDSAIVDSGDNSTSNAATLTTSSATGQHMTGIMYFDRPTLASMIDGSFYRNQFPKGVVGQLVSHTGGTPLSTAAGAHHYSMFMNAPKWDLSPSERGLININFDNERGTEAFVYGLFAGTNESELYE